MRFLLPWGSKCWFVVTGEWPEQIVLTGRILRYDPTADCYVVLVCGHALDINEQRVFPAREQAERARAEVQVRAEDIFRSRGFGADAHRKIQAV